MRLTFRPDSLRVRWIQGENNVHFVRGATRLDTSVDWQLELSTAILNVERAKVNAALVGCDLHVGSPPFGNELAKVLFRLPIAALSVAAAVAMPEPCGIFLQLRIPAHRIIVVELVGRIGCSWLGFVVDALLADPAIGLGPASCIIELSLLVEPLLELLEPPGRGALVGHDVLHVNSWVKAEQLLGSSTHHCDVTFGHTCSRKQCAPQ